MKITIVTTLRDGRVGTTTSPVSGDLHTAADFIAALASGHPDDEFTITAMAGPDYSARFGDVTSVRLEVEL
jgi:hypothetical protein